MKHSEQGRLSGVGYAQRDIKLYPGKQILATVEVYKGQEGSAADRVAGVIRDDIEGRDLYLDYAREGRCGLWLRVHGGQKVPKALRVLADHDYLHTRYYGINSETDYNLSGPRT